MAPTSERRAMGLGEWTDKIVIVSLGCIFIWFGSKVETLTDKVQTLCETMAAITVELRSTKDETTRLRDDFQAHVKEDQQHAREDRQKVPLFGWRAK